MRPNNKYGRDPTLPEDELLRLAQEEQSLEALHELVECHFRDLADQIARYALGHGVQEADVQDIVQDFYPVLRKAILHGYDRGWLRGPNPCRLRTFLGKVALNHACDARRKLRRLQRHDAQALCHAQDMAVAAEGTAAPDWLDPSAAWENEPVLVAEGNEALAALAIAAAGFSADDRLLWDATWERVPAGELAGGLGVSVSTVHRRWWRLLSRLWAEIGCRY